MTPGGREGGRERVVSLAKLSILYKGIVTLFLGSTSLTLSAHVHVFVHVSHPTIKHNIMKKYKCSRRQKEGVR
jgi:hypothetical protein